MPTSTKVSIVVSTYRRPDSLLDCIKSLVDYTQAAAEVIVVGREGDTPTQHALLEAQKLCAGKTHLEVSWVTEPGHAPPVEKGVKLAAQEVVAILDDDVTVAPDWLEHLIAPFADPAVGVVGGRAIAPGWEKRRLKGKPGCTAWYGKHWGNVASLPGDSLLDVQSVMECNWAWRRSLLASLAFDPVLNFDDASMYGFDLCLRAKMAGFRVLYEPRALVYHHVAPRVRGLDRADRPRRAFSYTRNYTYIMLKNLPRWRRPIFLAWWFLIGERGSCGLVAVLADALSGRPPRLQEVWGAWKGKVEGLRLAAARGQVHV